MRSFFSEQAVGLTIRRTDIAFRTLHKRWGYFDAGLLIRKPPASVFVKLKVKEFTLLFVSFLFPLTRQVHSMPSFQVVSHAHPRPLQRYFLQSPEQESSKSDHTFDDPKHRLHRLLPQFILGFPVPGLHPLLEHLQHGASLRHRGGERRK